MKALRLCLLVSLLGCVSSLAAVPPVLPPAVVGNYQALLYTGADNTGVPAGLVTLTTLATGKATGKLTTDENKTYSFTATFNYVADTFEGDELQGISTTTATVSIPRTKMTALALTMAIVHNKVENADVLVFKPVLSGTGADELAPKRTSNSGFKNVVFAAKTSADYAGKYTLAFEGADPAGLGEPQGSGYATGVVSATGALTLAGKTGDGVAITASLPAGPNRNYVAYLNPYKTAGSFLGGKINLVARTSTGFHAVPAESPNYDFRWAKAAKTADKSYPAGFGSAKPIGVLLTMEPWKTVPALPKGQTLGTMLGLTSDKVFDLGFQGNLNTATYATSIPAQLGLNTTNTFRVAKGVASTPSPLQPAAWAKVFTAKVDPATGKITGSITIQDTLMVGTPAKAKVVTRKLVLEGVMLQLDSGDTSPFAQGFVQVPPIDAKTATTYCDRFAFLGPVVTDPFIAMAAETAGKYTTKVKQLVEFDLDGFSGPNITVNITGKMTGLPADGSVVPFTIAPDLSYLTFNGRKLPLKGDSRPVSLVFSDLTTATVKNNLTVNVFLNTSTGVPTSVTAFYVQLVAAKITTSGIPVIGSRTVAGLVPGLGNYIENEAPIKQP